MMRILARRHGHRTENHRNVLLLCSARPAGPRPPEPRSECRRVGEGDRFANVGFVAGGDEHRLPEISDGHECARDSSRWRAQRPAAVRAADQGPRRATLASRSFRSLFAIGVGIAVTSPLPRTSGVKLKLTPATCKAASSHVQPSRFITATCPPTSPPWHDGYAGDAVDLATESRRCRSDRRLAPERGVDLSIPCCHRSPAAPARSGRSVRIDEAGIHPPPWRRSLEPAGTATLAPSARCAAADDDGAALDRALIEDARVGNGRDRP